VSDQVSVACHLGDKSFKTIVLVLKAANQFCTSINQSKFIFQVITEKLHKYTATLSGFINPVHN